MNAPTPLPDMLSHLEWTGIFPAKTYFLDHSTVRSLDQHIEIQQGLAVRQPFRAARHSVTVGQFALFLKETGTKPCITRWQQPQLPDSAPAGEIYCTEVIPFCHWMGERLRLAERIPQTWQVDLPRMEEWLVANDRLFLHPEPTDVIERSGPRPDPDSGGLYREWLWTQPVDWDEPPFESDWGKVISSLGQGLRMHREGRTVIGSTALTGTWDTDLGFRVVCRAPVPAL